MAVENIDIDKVVQIKMELDKKETDWALDDSLLLQQPIVYTTKLDDMRITKQNWGELSAEEITNKLQSENKPQCTLKNLQNTQSSGNLESFNKLCRLVQHINFKARIQKHSTNVRNVKLLKHCKPCFILLKDIKKSSRWNKTVTLLHDTRNESGIETNLIDSRRNKRSEWVTMETHEEIKKEIIAPSDTESPEVQINGGMVEISSDSESSGSLTRTTTVAVSSKNKLRKASKSIKKQNKSKDVNHSEKRNKSIESRKHSTETVSSSKSTKTLLRAKSSDEEDTALINMKRKPTPETLFTLKTSSLERFFLIVLIYQRKEAFVYRGNPVKLITDYYKMTDFDEYKLGAFYPNEEKIIEDYCCWFKREEVVLKICTQKNYSYAIQKFLKQSHSCHTGDCRCCCCSNVSKQSKLQSTVLSTLTVSDSWIRGLLNRNQPASTGLVNKALSYIPKTQVKEKPVEKEPETFLGSVLLRIKLSENKNNVGYVAELYEIGKNGNVVRSFFLNDFEKEKAIRKSYNLIGIFTMDAEFCCWYKRERLMNYLQTLKLSPAALKSIQRPHNCERRKCTCCCRPNKISLKAIETLPNTLKHTTIYENNLRSLTVGFNFKSKLPASQGPNSYLMSVKSSNFKDASFAAKVLSTCASKDDNQELNVILSKFSDVKLGVTTEGKLEVMLNGPARNLSIAKLKVLSEILDLSTKQIAELGLSPQEFCNRINSKRTQSNPVNVAPEEQKDHTVQLRKVSTELLSTTGVTTALPIENKHTNNDLTSKKVTSKSNTTKSLPNMYSSISNLMETKSKKYVESFKSFFRNNIPVSFYVPEMIQFPPVHGLAKFTREQTSLPKITETFTLTNLPTEASYKAVAGPSGITLRPQIESIVTESSQDIILKRPTNTNPGLSTPTLRIKSTSNQTPTLTNVTKLEKIKVSGNISKRTVTNSEKKPEDKRIRVKSPSELMAKTNQVFVIADNLQTKEIPILPKPIIFKRDLNTVNVQSIANTSRLEGIQINPDLHTQTYRLVPNNVVSNAVYGLGNTTTAFNNLYQLNGNGRTKVVTTSDTNTKSMRYLTLTPITSPNNNNMNKTILASILKAPQVQPTVIRPCAPSLAPVNAVPVALNEVSDKAHLDFDVEDSLGYSLIKIANPEN